MKLKVSENVFSICLSYHKMHLERKEGLEHLGLCSNFVPWWAPHFPYQKYITSPQRLIIILQRNISGYQVIVLSSQKGKLRLALFLQEVIQLMPPVFWHRPWCYTSKSPARAGRDCMAGKAKQVYKHCFKMSDLCTGMRKTHFICSTGRQRSFLCFS